MCEEFVEPRKLSFNAESIASAERSCSVRCHDRIEVVHPSSASCPNLTVVSSEPIEADPLAAGSS